MLTSWLDRLIEAITKLASADTFLAFPHNVEALIALVLTSLICGAVGAMVVGNRMAFFSDALAHCAFAGVALGLIVALAVDAEDWFYQRGIYFIMAGFGILVGLAIVYVREATSLSNDTVIGVFFAGSLGFGAIMLTAIGRRRIFNPEVFLFGSVSSLDSEDLLVLIGLAVVTIGLLVFIYNHLVFTSFNASLARSRQIPMRLCNYLFIILLALIVNLCAKIVGVLLITALLIVPAATAANLSRNLRQMFWLTAAICLLVSIGGLWTGWEAGVRLDFYVGYSGPVVVISVLFFFASIAVGPWRRGRQAS